MKPRSAWLTASAWVQMIACGPSGISTCRTQRSSLETLALAARRLESERLALLLGARGNIPPAGFERDFPELLLPPRRARGRLNGTRLGASRAGQRTFTWYTSDC